ncbi:exported hypothetical protein [Candidatus Magnetomoraceae bacterium gMMP-13]
MQKKLIKLLLILISFVLTACSSSPEYGIFHFFHEKHAKLWRSATQHQARYRTYDYIHKRPYLVFGRVIDSTERPVGNCKIVLIKRKISGPLPAKPGTKMFDEIPVVLKFEILNEIPVAITDKAGEYTFVFEPHGANDIWLYFDAEDGGFVSRFVEVTPLMGTTFFETWGNSPINLNVIIEALAKKQKEKPSIRIVEKIVERRIVDEKMIIPPTIYFDTNSDIVKDNYKEKLKEFVKKIKKHRDYQIHIIGYADERGTVAHNKQLSLSRANAVMRIIEDYGINIGYVVGAGEIKPVTNKGIEIAHDVNRKVEIRILELQK